MKETWEEKFDENFYECIGDSPCDIDEVKSFISSQIKQAYKLGYDEGFGAGVGKVLDEKK